MTHDTESLITHHRFFTGMSHHFAKSLATCATVKLFPAGAMLGREGTPADSFFAILDGRVAIETYQPGSRPVILQTLHQGEIVGWSWMYAPHEWVFDARALTETKVMAFDGAKLRKACDSDPALALELMKRLAQVMTSRLKAARLQLLDVYGRREPNKAPDTEATP